MNDALSWIGEIIRAVGQLIPRLIIVKATHRGVKWVQGKKVREMLPGLHWYWPVTTDAEVIVSARQTLNLPSQALLTTDNKPIVFGCLIVYSIRDVILAVGEKNWDVDTTVCDIGQSAVTAVVSTLSFEEVKDLKTTAERITQECRKKLKQFGVAVHRCAVTDFTACKMLKLLTTEQVKPEPPLFYH